MIFRINIICYLLLSLSFLQSNSLNNFAFELFKTINNQKDENVLISPLSVSYALMMVNKGALGSTSDNILSTLNISSDDLEQHYSLIKDYTNNLAKKNLSINNGIWIQEDNCYYPNRQYISFIDSIFKGDIFYVDFAKNSTNLIEDINNWVFDVTYGMIDDIVSENDIKATTVQALLNAVHFKAQWSIPFDSMKTELDYFNIGANQKQVYMMNKKNRYPYYYNEEFQLLELQYVDTDISMFIFLPNNNQNLNSFINDFNVSTFRSSIDSLKIKPGNIFIPMFKNESSYSLKEPLQSMGMNIPFSAKLASFDGFWDYNDSCFKEPPVHYIDLINHKTNIDLDENGVEVAAATSVIINRITSISPFIEPFIFKANRPFLYLIYDKEYNKIIFIGKYIGV